jgi:hypothetical protein
VRDMGRIWLCGRCQIVYRSALPASEVRCSKGHRMKMVASEDEIEIEKAKEGITT